MQKKLIAAAVAGALAAPVAVADVAVSGSIRTGVEYTGSEWVVADNGSRLRFKANSDLGNGQSAFMNYEFRVNSAKGSIVTGNTQRLTYRRHQRRLGSTQLGFPVEHPVQHSRYLHRSFKPLRRRGLLG